MIPLIRPDPPRLSEVGPLLRQIEDRGVFSNFGPVNTGFERDLLDTMFNGVGACMTVCNATIGLMLAIRQATERRGRRRRYALMPSFTFAAAAHAACWCGLTPLLCDIDPVTWAADPAAEEQLLQRFHGQVAVIVPYATFGFDIDLDRYERLRSRFRVPVVVDAAASLGTQTAGGGNFGTGFGGTVVYSMHATKSFSTAEGGVVYSADAELIAQLRLMCNFGFGLPRTATMPGLNGKLSEVGALLAQLRLAGYGARMAHRARLMEHYRAALPALGFQPASARIQAHQFAPVLLPGRVAGDRAGLQERLRARGVGTGAYFSPHVAEQDYFGRNAVAGALPVTEDVASRIISLPLFDAMTVDEVDTVAGQLTVELDRLDAPVASPAVPAVPIAAWPHAVPAAAAAAELEA